MRRTSAVVLFLVSIAQLGGCLFACGPAHCPQAVQGRAEYDAVIAALSAYHREQASYPAVLEDLVPRYLHRLPPGTEPDGPQLYDYRTENDGYQLVFQYFGPGANRCRYSPTQGWRCSGYY